MDITLSDTDYTTLTNALRTAAATYDDLAANQRQHNNPRLAEQFDRQATTVRALLDRIETEDAPTAEQLAALRAYAALHGRTWKAALRQDWMSACEFISDREQAGYLQQLRNTLGPKWLEGFTLTDARTAVRCNHEEQSTNAYGRKEYRACVLTPGHAGDHRFTSWCLR